jgi:hypothetical protein
MVPAPAPSDAAPPLADYFFISGIESSQVYDERSQPKPNGLSTIPSPGLSSPPPLDVDETIEEDRALETDSIRPKSQDGLSLINGDTSRRSSGRLSYEHRKSTGTIVGPDSKQTASNRSSTTIKGVQLGGSGLSDQDFENALRKFASERDTFLEEIQFSAGITQQSRSTPSKPARPRPQRIQLQQEDGVGNHRTGVGSIRRRISTMQSSLKRTSSVATRQGKSKRLARCAVSARLELGVVIAFDIEALLTWVQHQYAPRNECLATIQSSQPHNPSTRSRTCIPCYAVTNPYYWIATRPRTWSRS